MMSKNESVSCSSLVLLFCHVCEILVERKKKLASQPCNPIAYVYCFFFNNSNVNSKDFYEKDMLYDDSRQTLITLFFFFLFFLFCFVFVFF